MNADDKEFKKKLIEETVAYVQAIENHPSRIPDERLKYRWNLSDEERAHLKNCGLCRNMKHDLYHHPYTTPAERREIMKKGLEKGKELTLAEIEEMLNPKDGLLHIDDEKTYLAKNGQWVTENVHAKDCPCLFLEKFLNGMFGLAVVLRPKPTISERIGRWMLRRT